VRAHGIPAFRGGEAFLSVFHQLRKLSRGCESFSDFSFRRHLAIICEKRWCVRFDGLVSADAKKKTSIPTKPSS